MDLQIERFILCVIWSNMLFIARQIEWYNSWLNALNNIERLYQKKDVADIIQAKVVQVCHSTY